MKKENKKYINVYKKFNGSFIPEWMEKSEVSHGAKITYGRLVRYAGKNAKCHPKMKTLAEDINSSKSSCYKYIKELKDAGFIESIKRGRGLPNDYYFLRHPKMKFKSEDEERKNYEIISARVENMVSQNGIYSKPPYMVSLESQYMVSLVLQYMVSQRGYDLPNTVTPYKIVRLQDSHFKDNQLQDSQLYNINTRRSKKETIQEKKYTDGDNTEDNINDNSSSDEDNDINFNNNKTLEDMDTLNNTIDKLDNFSRFYETKLNNILVSYMDVEPDDKNISKMKEVLLKTINLKLNNKYDYTGDNKSKIEMGNVADEYIKSYLNDTSEQDNSADIENKINNINSSDENNAEEKGKKFDRLFADV